MKEWEEGSKKKGERESVRGEKEGGRDRDKEIEGKRKRETVKQRIRKEARERRGRKRQNN